MIGIVDTKNANIKALSNIYLDLGVDHRIISNKSDFENISKLILPGIGNFDSVMENLNELDLYNLINDFAVSEKKPILGICIGMQIFFNSSEEGNQKGFGWIDSEVVKLNAKDVRYPHIGWNNVKMKKKSYLFNQIDNKSYFYFLHSFGVKNNKSSFASNYGKSNYGEEFVSVIINNNLFGVQFHPEKSHSNGTQLLLNFSKI